jgi:O-antigen biosynthesis protein WbqV
VELAERVIERAGLRPGEDVPIIFCGKRPGEKLNEQLMSAGEIPSATATQGVWSVAVEQRGFDELSAQLDDLQALAETGDDVAVRRRLAAVVHGYEADNDADTEEPAEGPLRLDESAMAG